MCTCLALPGLFLLLILLREGLLPLGRAAACIRERATRLVLVSKTTLALPTRLTPPPPTTAVVVVLVRVCTRTDAKREIKQMLNHERDCVWLQTFLCRERCRTCFSLSLSRVLRERAQISRCDDAALLSSRISFVKEC